MLLDLPIQAIYPYFYFDPQQNPGPRAALRVNDVLDVVMQSDVIPALVGLDVEGHLPQTRYWSGEYLSRGHNLQGSCSNLGQEERLSSGEGLAMMGTIEIKATALRAKKRGTRSLPTSHS